MRKMFPLVGVAAATVAVTLSITSFNSRAQAGSSYADDRAAIEDLQARYLFAMDFHNPDLYVTMFTEDGILDVGSGEIKGRQAIRDTVAKMPNFGAGPVPPGLWPASGRHNISNIVVKINGNRATGRAYWFHYANNNPERRGTFTGYGHYEDEMVKTNGQWFFSKRRIYNEQRKEWAYPGTGNPAW